MNILTLGRFVVIFTIVKCTPLPSDPDSDVEIIRDPPVIILQDDSDSDVEIITDPPVIIIPDDSDSGDNDVEMLPEEEDHDMDQQPNFLRNGVTGHEIIQQTPEVIRVYVRPPPLTRSELYHPRDQPSTSTGRRGPYRGPTLRREWAHLAACMKRRSGVDNGIRRNIGK